MSKGKAKGFVKEVKEEIKQEDKAFKEDKANKKFTFNKIISIVLWVILFSWIGICLTDFFRANKEKPPVFCLKKQVTKYEDGTVDKCLGLGYKVYSYKRTNYNGMEYGALWITDKSAKDSTK